MYFYCLFSWPVISHNIRKSIHSQDQKASTPSSRNLGSSFPLAGATIMTGRPSTVGVAADFAIGDEGLEEHLQRPPRACGCEGAIITFQAVGQFKVVVSCCQDANLGDYTYTRLIQDESILRPCIEKLAAGLMPVLRLTKVTRMFF